jgi:hypothetical protein
MLQAERATIFQEGSVCGQRDSISQSSDFEADALPLRLSPFANMFVVDVSPSTSGRIERQGVDVFSIDTI